MFKFILSCFFVFAFVQANLDFTKLDKEQFNKIVDECKKTFNITEDLEITETDTLVQANETSNEPHNVQCFTHCIISKAFPDNLYENGSFITEKLGVNDSDSKINQEIMKCLQLDGEDACETTFKQFTCSFGLLLVAMLEKFFQQLADNLENIVS